MARLRVGIPELFFIAGQDACHHRMLGLVGLQQCHARLVRPSGAAGHLPHQLKRSLSRAQIRSMQAQIRINHAHQRQFWKIMTFGHQLGANDNICGALRYFFDLFFERPRRAKHIRRKSHYAGLRKKLCCFFGKPLYSRTNGSQLVLCLAGRAACGFGLTVTALVAHQTI